MEKKFVSECYIERAFGINHENVPELARRQYYFVGKLFPHQKICAHCVIKLTEGSKQIIGMGDDYELKELWKQRNPEYVALIDKLGEGIVRTEINRNITELPFEPKTYEMGMPIEFGEPGERAGNPPPTSKKPKVVVE